MFKKHGLARISLAPAASQDIRDILKWSTEKFGKQAAARYRALIVQALRDIEAEPNLLGSKERSEIAANARTYHMSLSRDDPAEVKEPRHFVLYRQRPDGTIEIGRILHDSRDLARHIPPEYK